MQKALGREPAEEPLHHTLLQVEVDDSLVHATRIFKHDGTNRRIAAPFPWLLVAFPGNTQAVHCLEPRRIGAFALIDCRECKSSRIAILSRCKRLEWLGPGDLQGAGDCVAEVLFFEADAFL